MKNPNALIAMAQVAQNVNNPYEAFCEYIKYCVFSNTSDIMTLTEIREAIGKEFGLYMPHNILLNCLSYVQAEGAIIFDMHQIKRIGTFDTEAFDKERDTYRATESAIIQALIQYASKYNRNWTEEYARELLVKALDRNGLAYDIFSTKKVLEPNIATQHYVSLKLQKCSLTMKKLNRMTFLINHCLQITISLENSLRRYWQEIPFKKTT